MMEVVEDEEGNARGAESFGREIDRLRWATEHVSSGVVLGS